MKDKNHIVLDTNCLIMAISARNEYHLIWQSFLRGDYVLCVPGINAIQLKLRKI